MKRTAKLFILVAAVSVFSFTSCTKKDSTTKSDASKTVTLNLWSFTDEVPGMVEKYIATHPDCGFTLNKTIIATTDGAYQPALD